MLFKIASRVNLPGQPVRTTSSPERLKMYAEEGAKISIGEIRIHKLKGVLPGGKIRGAYRTSKPAEVRLLMKVGGLDFDAQEAVDEGILTYKEVTEMGWKVNDTGPVKMVPAEEEIPEALPDFDTMTIQRLIDWGLDQTPPINLDPRQRKDKVKSDLLSELEKRKD